MTDWRIFQDNRVRLINFCWILLIAVLAVAGCEKGRMPATQAAARVNSDEISVHQINAVLSNVKGIAPENTARIKQEILDKLIDQRLAVQQAIDKHLDRTPAVMQAIEAAKAEVLARAYREQIAGSLSKPTTEEARKFYTEHPELFSHRRIYTFQEIILPSEEKILEEIRQSIAQRRSMQEIASILKENKIRFETNTVMRSAEQIPLDLLPKYNGMKDGQTLLIETPQTAIIAFLVASQYQPVDAAVAIPQIQNFLGGRQAEETIGREMKRLRAQAKIKLLGEFARGSAAFDDKTVATANGAALEKRAAPFK
ncbi:MAG TPA: EpsD family peptidyl-prolyl cis-trans isomerase [Rhodocyclaceae bacterium]|jgi:EpsD family peptidyl-prolyl cis-trans isomerase|nr:EpsD family peptidyl-prolyl cis-trans isomerase [Rhodocyclaceae bacterium]